MPKVAILGGSGFETLSDVKIVSRRNMSTPYGVPSDAIIVAEQKGLELAFLSRHGQGRKLAPHQVNYRANLWALAELGVEKVFSVNAVGAIVKGLEPGHFAVPDQLIDYTWGREQSFDLRPEGSVQHIDFTYPYSSSLRAVLIEALSDMNLSHRDSGVYGCTQGPRLETAAEVRRLGAEGVDVLGMTGMPEAALARELSLEYASLCLVVNRAAGLDTEPLSLPEILRALGQGMANARTVIGVALEKLDYCGSPGP